MTRLVTLAAMIALALPAAIEAAELAPRPDAPGFRARFGGARQAKTAARPALKSEATVIGDVVRIGDLIENAGAAAEVAIFRAPDLGQTGTVPAQQVIDAVLPHRIIALDTRGIAEVAVTRASRLITAK